MNLQIYPDFDLEFISYRFVLQIVLTFCLFISPSKLIALTEFVFIFQYTAPSFHFCYLLSILFQGFEKGSIYDTPHGKFWGSFEKLWL